jgi:hypothetical protein
MTQGNSFPSQHTKRLCVSPSLYYAWGKAGGGVNLTSFLVLSAEIETGVHKDRAPDRRCI